MAFRSGVREPRWHRRQARGARGCVFAGHRSSSDPRSVVEESLVISTRAALAMIFEVPAHRRVIEAALSPAFAAGHLCGWKLMVDLPRSVVVRLSPAFAAGHLCGHAVTSVTAHVLVPVTGFRSRSPLRPLREDVLQVGEGACHRLSQPVTFAAGRHASDREVRQDYVCHRLSQPVTFAAGRSCG